MMTAMKAALEPLFLPILSGEVDIPADSRILFLNALVHPALQRFASVECVQYFRPYADLLEKAGLKVSCGLDDDQDNGGDDTGLRIYDAAFVLGTKSRLETEINLGKAVLALKKGGVLICAADNKEGAGRLKKMFQHLGFEGLAEASKNKARVCWAVKPDGLDENPAQGWADQDRVQGIEGGFSSCPGIYGWDKVDKGSALLAENLPKDLNGHGADFGCGYGFLARTVLEKCRKAKSVDCVDADVRAVKICMKNFECGDYQARFYWLDLTVRQPRLDNKYDWIVMNPPFHEGKKTDSDIGIAFIKNAYAALRRKGELVMVANNQLPYERILSEIFWSSEQIAQGGGFKVFRAVK